MYSDREITLVREYLKYFSQADVAKLLKLHRHFVGRVARGYRIPKKERLKNEGRILLRRVPKYKCNGCQHKVVYKPCIICTVRLMKKNNDTRNVFIDESDVSMV